jgi:hypothetical protein
VKILPEVEPLSLRLQRERITKVHAIPDANIGRRLYNEDYFYTSPNHAEVNNVHQIFNKK